MFAPRPTNRAWLLVLLACLTDSSLASAASTTRTVYRPLAAGQVPRPTGAAVATAAITPPAAPVRVRTVAPFWSSTVSVMPCAPPAEAMLPWLRTDTEKLTGLPAAGVLGDQVTAAATRSELATG